MEYILGTLLLIGMSFPAFVWFMEKTDRKKDVRLMSRRLNRASLDFISEEEMNASFFE